METRCCGSKPIAELPDPGLLSLLLLLLLLFAAQETPDPKPKVFFFNRGLFGHDASKYSRDVWAASAERRNLVINGRPDPGSGARWKTHNAVKELIGETDVNS